MILRALLCACVLVLSRAAPPRGRENDRPIIGILAQEVVDDEMKKFGKTFIPSSYVKYIESGGARVTPIRLRQSSAEHQKIFSSINGLLLIGGSVSVQTSDFAHTAATYFRLALKANEAGDHFPIWGTCLGFQLLATLVSGENLLSETTAENISYPLNLTTEAWSSRMFQSFPANLLQALSEEPLTANFHRYGVTRETFAANQKLSRFFHVLSTNVAQDHQLFVSTMEGRSYPIYGVQWHPEVNRFQWEPHHSFPHSSHAVQVSALLVQFLVDESRRSSHRFRNVVDESESLIYNYSPVYVGNISAYEQSYFF